VRVSEVDRADEGLRVVHHPEHAVDQVVHVTERAGLPAGLENRDVPAVERLNDEVADDPAVSLGTCAARRC
jgi:hypothetical protein